MRVSTTVPVGSTSVVALVGLIVSTLRRRSHPANGVLILGTSPLAAKVIDEIDARADDRFRLIGAVDDSVDGKGAPGVTPLLGRLNQFSQIVAATQPAHIVIAMTDRRGRVPEGLLLDWRFRGVNVEDAVDFFERLTGKLAIESLSPSSLILSKEFRHADLRGSVIQRALRRSVSLILRRPWPARRGAPSGSHRACDQAGVAGPGALCPGPNRPRWKAVRALQVPNDACRSGAHRYPNGCRTTPIGLRRLASGCDVSGWTSSRSW